MDPTLLHDIMEKQIYVFKKSLISHLEDNPTGAFSQIPERVLIMEDVRSYLL